MCSQGLRPIGTSPILDVMARNLARNESTTFTHRKRHYMVTRLSPRGLADAQQVAYTVPRFALADRVVVYGHLLPAVFVVEGWQHRVTMTLDADMRPSVDHGVYVSQLTIDVTYGFPDRNTPRLTSTADLRGMPLGVWLDAAASLCAFRGTARPKRYASADGRTVNAHAFHVTTPRAAANGHDALIIEAVGLAARTPAKLTKTYTGRKSKRVALPPWNGREALREVARLWRLQDADPTVRGGMNLYAWLESQTGRPANTCSQQLTEARRAGLLPAAKRRGAVKRNTNTKRGKR